MGKQEFFCMEIMEQYEQIYFRVSVRQRFLSAGKQAMAHKFDVGNEVLQTIENI